MGEPLFMSQPISDEYDEDFGRRQKLDISSDGTIVAIASPDRVDVFQLNSVGAWERRGQSFTNITSTSDEFGFVVTQLTPNGDILAIATTSTDGPEGLYGYTAVYKYSTESDLWELIGGRIPGFNEYTYSKAISLSADGTVVAVGNPSEIGQGQVRVYSRDRYCPAEPVDSNLTWCQVGRPLAGGDYEDLFGHSVSLSSDGFFLAIGAPGIDLQCGGPSCFKTGVYKYFVSTNEWRPYGQTLYGGSGFGHLVYLSPDAGTLAVAEVGGSDTAYSVHLYEMQLGVWQLSFTLTGSIFGYGGYISMDLSGSSPYTLAVGSSARDFWDGPSSVSLYHN
jgi:hypothetical protein